MTHILQLPRELLFQIANYLPSQNDINSFVQTSRTIHHCLQPSLYKYNVQHCHSSALLWAARNGNTQVVKTLLNLGANIAWFEPGRSEDDLSYEPETRNNPLLNAAQGGYMETLKIMLSETRPDRASAPSQLRTVLHWAIRHNDLDLVELMISSKAPLDSNVDTLEQETALDVAVLSRSNLTVTECLLRRGAWLSQDGFRDPFSEVVLSRQTEFLWLLLDYGQWPASDESLCHIASKGYHNMLLLLIQYGLKVEFYGHSALFMAVMHGRYDIVKLLIETGANPHLTCQGPRNGAFYSTIRYAIEYRHLDILKLLIDKGVHPDSQDLQFAEETDFKEAVDLLSAFNFDNLPEKVHLEDFVSKMEEEGRADPDFHPMRYTLILHSPPSPLDTRSDEDGFCEIYAS